MRSEGRSEVEIGGEVGENWDRGCEGWGRGGGVEVEGRVRSGVGLRLDGRGRGCGIQRWSGMGGM